MTTSMLKLWKDSKSISTNHLFCLIRLSLLQGIGSLFLIFLFKGVRFKLKAFKSNLKKEGWCMPVCLV